MKGMGGQDNGAYTCLHIPCTVSLDCLDGGIHRSNTCDNESWENSCCANRLAVHDMVNIHTYAVLSSLCV